MSQSWYKVDNVAKVFLATASRRDPRVIRISCTLQDPVQPELLNEALRSTARNFFNSVYVGIVVKETDTLETLAPQFDALLKEKLLPENIRAQMDEFETLEHMPGIRPVPLVIKNAVVNLFTQNADKRVTAVLSNMGRLSVPEKLTPYVRSFSAFSSAKTLFTVVTSYGDDLVLGTASALRSTNVLSRLYRGFVQNGLAVTLYATEVEK